MAIKTVIDTNVLVSSLSSRFIFYPHRGMLGLLLRLQTKTGYKSCLSDNRYCLNFKPSIEIMSKLQLKASIGNLPKNKRVDVQVLIVAFVEESLYYYYAPQLDVYGYGQTETEAKESFEITLHEFFRYTLNKGTLQRELKRLGWKLQTKTKAISAPDFSHLLQSSAELKDIVENRSFTKTHHLIQMPAVA